MDSYYLGRVIGAGSFGVVREGIKVATGKRFAVKTVSKVPKRGAPTPRCVHLRLDCQRRGVSIVRGVREGLEQKSVVCKQHCCCWGDGHGRKIFMCTGGANSGSTVPVAASVAYSPR